MMAQAKRRKAKGRVAVPESSRTNADDRLPLASLGRVEGGDGIVEGRDVANVRPQPGLDLGYASRLHTGQSLERQLGYFSGEDLEFCIRRAAC